LISLFELGVSLFAIVRNFLQTCNLFSLKKCSNFKFYFNYGSSYVYFTLFWYITL